MLNLLLICLCPVPSGATFILARTEISSRWNRRHWRFLCVVSSHDTYKIQKFRSKKTKNTTELEPTLTHTSKLLCIQLIQVLFATVIIKIVELASSIKNDTAKWKNLLCQTFTPASDLIRNMARGAVHQKHQGES